MRLLSQICYKRLPAKKEALLVFSNIVLISKSRFFFSDVHLWQIVAEIVRLCCIPPPRNPFEVDHNYFENVAVKERVLVSAAMVNFLHKLLQEGQGRSYEAKGKIHVYLFIIVFLFIGVYYH